MFYMYILRNPRNNLYIGHTQNIDNRLLDHSGKEIKYTRSNGGRFKLIYFEKFATRSHAMKRERQIKGWTRVKKEALVAGDKELLKKL